MRTHCEIITTIKIINTSITSQSHHFLSKIFFVVRTFKIYPPSQFEVHRTVFLTTVTLLYIRYPEPIHLVTEILYPLSTSPHVPLPPYIILFYCGDGFMNIYIYICVSKLIKLFTLNMYSLLYVNFASLKLFFLKSIFSPSVYSMRCPVSAERP